MFDSDRVDEVVAEWVRTEAFDLRTRVRLVVIDGERFIVERDETRIDGEWQVPAHKEGNGWEMAAAEFVDDTDKVEWVL